MIHPIIIPDLGATGGDVVLEEWLVEPGQKVTNGQALFLLTTDKASVEVEAFQDGYIRELKARAGQSLPVGALVALLADSLDEPLDEPPIDSEVNPLDEPPDEPEVQPEVQPPGQPGREGEARSTVETNQITGPSQTPQAPAGRRILASPLARRVADQEGIDLRFVLGSGNQGQILKRDVMLALSGKVAERAQTLEAGGKRAELTAMQRAVAERVMLSKEHAPHFYATITIEMGAALAARVNALEWAEKRGWRKPTISDLCIKAAALCLQEFPALNATFDGTAITTFSQINIGFVIGLEQGMLVPVIHEADKLDLFSLAQNTSRLREQAEAGRLAASDLRGGTFTLSNLGMFGLDSFTAIINPPQTGILALGAVQDKPFAVDGALTVKPQMSATLSVDHRVVDGITAARFCAAFKEMLENSERLTSDLPEDMDQ